MRIENLLTKKNRLDRRLKLTANLRVWFNRYTRAAAVWGLLVGTVGTLYVIDQPNNKVKLDLSKPLSQTIEVKPIEAKENKYQARGYAYCFDPITCIRDIGEEMGFSNQDIITAIKIGKCESGLRPDAMNKNKNGTFDLGVMQINDVHGKRINRQDRLDFEKNIRFAWTLRKEQGHWGAWSCYKLINK